MVSKKKKSWQPYRVARSQRTGLGLFATALIKKGEFIIEYTGKKIKTKEADDLGTKYLFDLENGWTLDGSGRENTARYINHSCKPNAETELVRGKIVIQAIKTINPGEEVTYDYGEEYFDQFIKPHGCKCDWCVRKKAQSSKKKTAAA